MKPEGRHLLRAGVVAASATMGIVCVTVVAPSATAGPIFDRSFFDKQPATTIDFETDENSQPLGLIEGQTLAMPVNAYASQGILFGSPIAWVNDGNADFDAAQITEGSPNHAIPSSTVGSFEIFFTGVVRAFGIFVASNATDDPNGPSIIIKDDEGVVIDEINLYDFGGGFVHGEFGDADYGFMGYSIGGDIPDAGKGGKGDGRRIGSIIVTKQSAIFDDLVFSPIPTPGAWMLGAAAAITAFRRKR